MQYQPPQYQQPPPQYQPPQYQQPQYQQPQYQQPQYHQSQYTTTVHHITPLNELKHTNRNLYAGIIVIIIIGIIIILSIGPGIVIHKIYRYGKRAIKDVEKNILDYPMMHPEIATIQRPINVKHMSIPMPINPMTQQTMGQPSTAGLSDLAGATRLSDLAGATRLSDLAGATRLSDLVVNSPHSLPHLLPHSNKISNNHFVASKASATNKHHKSSFFDHFWLKFKTGWKNMIHHHKKK